jgi:hypothetical protein
VPSGALGRIVARTLAALGYGLALVDAGRRPGSIGHEFADLLLPGVD